MIALLFSHAPCDFCISSNQCNVDANVRTLQSGSLKAAFSFQLLSSCCPTLIGRCCSRTWARATQTGEFFSFLLAAITARFSRFTLFEMYLVKRFIIPNDRAALLPVNSPNNICDERVFRSTAPGMRVRVGKGKINEKCRLLIKLSKNRTNKRIQICTFFFFWSEARGFRISFPAF